jgi:hypothetical protein
MAFSAATAKIWPVPPDWSKGVGESLAWSTDLALASGTASSQPRAVRDLPSRQFSFETLAQGQARRTAAMLLAGYSGLWQLPIWPDVQWLAAPVASGTTTIPCATSGFDFVDGGLALLYAAVNTFEVVTIDTVAADHLALAAATTGAYAAGARLYPLRAARVQGGGEERLLSDDLGRRNLVFDIAEPCAWPALASPTSYLGHPVLDHRPDESDDPTASFARMVQSVDYGSGTPVMHDLPQFGIGTWQLHWKLFGRADRTWFRSLAYTLLGRAMPIWAPSFASDLKPVAAIAGGSTTMPVEWCGYTLFGKGKHNRKDLRIELTDGTVLYRRITDAAEAGTTESLTLSAALDAGSIAVSRIRSVSFMALSTLASDTVELQHETDGEGLATATTGFQAVLPDA